MLYIDPLSDYREKAGASGMKSPHFVNRLFIYHLAGAFLTKVKISFNP